MLSIEKLQEYGADTATGLERCMNSEDFYFRMIGMIAQEKSFDKLEEALKEDDLDKAFEAAHALKGVAGNLSLTPLYNDVAEITELLRARTSMDYKEYLGRILEQREKIRKLIEEE